VGETGDATSYFVRLAKKLVVQRVRWDGDCVILICGQELLIK
jgi:hypothetical protein